MNLVKNQYGHYDIIDNLGNLQGATDMGNYYIVSNDRIYDMYHTAWGWIIRVGEENPRIGAFRWKYMSKAYRGKYDFMVDYTYAKAIKDKTRAKAHLANIVRADGYKI